MTRDQSGGFSELSRLVRFLRRGIWELDYRHYTGPRRVLYRQLQVLMLAVRGMRQDEIRLRAASLSLITLLSVVPFLAVVFWVFQALGGVEDLRAKVEPFIYENLAVGSQEEAIAWLNRFIDQVHAGAVGGVGTAILIIAAIGLLGSMEQSFNKIWGIKRGRPLLNRFVVYWCLMTVGPILLAATLAGTAAITGWLPLGEGIGAAALGLIPMAITIGSFTLFYAVIPNTQVSIRHALAGGVAAGILFEIAKLAYAWVATNLFQHHAVYGSLGAVPVFIIWVNIIWIVILLGCELTFAHQNVSAFQQEGRVREAGQQFKEIVASRLMVEIVGDYERGGSPPSPPELSRRLSVPIRLVRDIMERLISTGLLLEVSRNGRDSGLVPARSPSGMTVADVIWAMRMRRGLPIELSQDDQQALLQDVLGRAEEAAGEIYQECSLSSLAERSGSERQPMTPGRKGMVGNAERP